jgi:hypothetical protein
MKTIGLVLALLLVPVGVALADNDVGCGVGTQIWEGKVGLGPKMAASFTNGLTFQSISLTFGLVNCNGKDAVTVDNSDLKLRHYASSHFDQIAREMAAGEGESLEVIAELKGIPAADRAAFRALAQGHFAELYSHDHVTVGEMLDTLDRVLAEDEALAVYSRS